MDGLLDASALPSAVDRSTPPTTVTEPGELFRGLSHELCRPLISLRAGFDLLLAGAEGPISQEQRCHVQGLRVQCDEMIRLTRTYLDHAGLVRSSTPIEWDRFRLGALLDETARQFSGRAEARGIDWRCTVQGDDGKVETDLACLQQVVGAIVENALAHAPPGGHVGLIGRIGADTWRIEVSDDGPGIPADGIERVFEPLVRLNPCKGLGMGLAVCRELVAKLKGEIRIDSIPDQGTTVTVKFPTTSQG